MVELFQSNHRAVLELEEGEKEMALLQEQMRELGMFERSYAHYLSFAFILFLLYSACYFLLTVLSSYTSIFFISIVFGFVIVQIGGLMHDASHQSIFISERKNNLASCLFGLAIGLNSIYWYKKHDLHHKHPNQEEHDPDLTVPFSFTCKHYENPKRMLRWIKSFQEWAYVPLCFGMLFHLHYKYNLLQPIQCYQKKTDIFSILWSCVCLGTWYGLPFLLTSPGKAGFFILISMGVMGFYAANVFAPNHKAMPQLEKDVIMSNLEQQIITTRNVTPGFLNDFIYLTLNYQIEHHLFPSCARNKYKLISPYVKSLTQRLGLPYVVQTPWESYRSILSELSNVRKACQDKSRV